MADQNLTVEIWPGCPVKPLGIVGETCAYLDAKGIQHFVANHTHNVIAKVFGYDLKLLAEHFPLHDSNGHPRPDTFNAQTALDAMVEASTAVERMRQEVDSMSRPPAPEAPAKAFRIGSWEHLVHRLRTERTCGRDAVRRQMIGRVVALKSHPAAGMTVIDADDVDGCRVATFDGMDVNSWDLPHDALTDFVDEEKPF